MIAAICLIIRLSPKPKKLSMSDTYIGLWHSTDNTNFAPIAKTLADNNIISCSEFHFKESITNNNEFLVACSNDSKNWNYYLVWPQVGKVIGLSNPVINAKEESELLKPPY